MHLAKSLTDFHHKCPTPWDCGCACTACLRDKANYIEKQTFPKEEPARPSISEAHVHQDLETFLRITDGYIEQVRDRLSLISWRQQLLGIMNEARKYRATREAFE